MSDRYRYRQEESLKEQGREGGDGQRYGDTGGEGRDRLRYEIREEVCSVVVLF